MKTMTARQHKVANEVQHQCALALVQGRVPTTLNVARMTIIDCWVSPDLRLARLYVQLPQGVEQEPFLKEANAQLSRGLRKVLAEKLGTKYTPDVTFFPAEEEF